MRVTSSQTYRNFQFNIESLNQELDAANQQIASGKKLVHLNVSPSDSAEVVDLRAHSAQVDQYQGNADAGSYLLSVADSALSSVHTIITSIFAKGSAAASDSNSTVRADLATEVRSLRDELLSLANTEARGRYIFSGSSVLSVPFTIAGDTATYQGDAVVNSVNIGSGLAVQENVPGSAVFSSIFESIRSLLTALDSGAKDAIGAALEQFSGQLATISQVRARVGSDLGRIQDQKTTLDTESTNIRMRKSQVEDSNLAETVTELTRIQTALKSALAAESMVGQHNLFDFLA
jgi:flagellar hook-associated protein 3 FlgL